MAVYSRYFSVTAFKERLDLTTTDAARDAYILDYLEEASRQIDRAVGRWFFPMVDTREFRAQSSTCLRLYNEDLLSITSLKADYDGDRTYESTWSTTDYDLMPENFTPYQWIETAPQGVYSFPLGRKGVQIAGIWGYTNNTVSSTATAAEAIDTSETGIDVSSGTVFDIGQSIRIDSEDMLITAIATNTLTVIRAINGTTAASHLTSTAIDYLAYEPPIQEACYLKALQSYKRRVGTGSGGNVTLGAGSAPSDKSIEEKLAPYKRRI